MKGLPPTVDLTSLSRARVIQLCFGENEFQVHFDNTARVVVESDMTLCEPQSIDVRIVKYGEAASQLCRILGDRVLNAVRTADGGLLLRFERGAELQILNNNAQFESFQVHIAGETYVA